MTETMDYKQMPADVLLNITSGSPASAQADGDLTEVLFADLIEFSDQERQRFERVKAILLETFH